MNMKQSVLITSMIMASMSGYSNMYDTRRRIKSDPLEGIDIEKEYELIMNKKSGLSARLRSMVLYRYEKQLNEIERR
ncbi:MAG: hypothetical protein ACRCZU_01120 [Selenomonadaceae bacterium]